ncbi:MAG TPA: hypothetical protein PK992_00935 [Planctomycetaceae bacterium]|nr:hypothetical protein [Planctomycetaceae bacterium]
MSMRISFAVTSLCLLLSSAFTCRVVEAQLPTDSGSQRILPLPEGRLSDFQTQMELLQRLRSLVEASEKPDQPSSVSPEDAPKVDAKQLAQLQRALKQLQSQLPPGMTPPDLGSIPQEQVDQAMSNPAVQQQLKEMLEQFSRDGLLPKGNDSTGSAPLPPLPRQPGESPNAPRNSAKPRTQPPVPPDDRSMDAQKPPRNTNSKSGDPKPNRNESLNPAANGGQEQSDSGSDAPKASNPPQKSWQSLKDAMKKLSEIAQGEKQKPQDGTESPEPSTESSTESPGSVKPTPSTGLKPKRIGANSNGTKNTEDARNPQPAVNGTGSNGTGSNGAGSNGAGGNATDTDDAQSQRQQSLQAFQDILERYKKSQQDGDRSTGGGEAKMDDNSLPEIRSGTRLPPDRNAGDENNQGASNRILRHPDRAAPIEQPDSQSKSSSGSPPSVSEFLQQQFRDGFPAPGSQETDQRSMSRGSNRSSGAPQPGGSSSDGSAGANQSNPASQNAQPNLDVRQELEKRGLRGTLQKLVEKARQESNTQHAQGDQQRSESITNQSGSPGDPNAGGQAIDNAGIRKSIQKMLGGLDHRMEDIAKDAEFRDRPADTRSPGNSEWQPAPSNSGSRANSWNNAASNFFKDISTAPQAPYVAPSSGGGDPSISAEAPLAIGSLVLVGLGLMGVVGVIAFLMRRPLMKMVSSATGIAGPKQVVRASDIRSRDDVITAFHQLVLNPKQLVEAWWTHRAAARTLAASSPQQEVAVQTLAEIYEQARYLPEDVELPVDQIQAARSALAQCQ